LERLWRASVLRCSGIFRNRPHDRRSEEAQERIGSLARPAGRKRETPKEEKAHEGRGLDAGLNRLAEDRTLAGSKALKWGVLAGTLSRYGRFGKCGLALTGRD
jgi:hypothetical protein